MKMIKLCIVMLLITGTLFAQEQKRVDYIIVAALEAETKGLEKYAPIVYTGVGKVNATMKLYEAILKYKPSLVINYGTAGGLNSKHGLLKIDTFVQRDMDVRPLGIKRGITPFENDVLPKAKGIVLGTGDSFVVNAKKDLEGLEVKVDLIDMEGYALNKVANYLKVKFESYKYVSDSANEEASNDWAANVAKGAKLFDKFLSQTYGKSTLKP